MPGTGRLRHGLDCATVGRRGRRHVSRLCGVHCSFASICLACLSRKLHPSSRRALSRASLRHYVKASAILLQTSTRASSSSASPRLLSAREMSWAA